MTALRSSSFLFATLLLTLLASQPSCGGNEPHAAAPTAPALDLDGDTVALLPAGAIGVVTVDMRALFGHPTFGAAFGALVEGFLPVGSEVGFVPSRDVDRVTVASYAVQGADGVAVLRGRFDAQAIDRTARASASKGGAGLVSATPYSGFTMYTSANMGFAVLTPRTILAGSGGALRLALDRIRGGGTAPGISPALSETLRARDVVAAGAGDLTASPLSGALGIPLPPWASSLKSLRGTAALKEANVAISGSLTFDTPANAAAAATGVKQLAALLNAMAIAGVVPKMDDLVSTPDGANVNVSFSLDNQGLRALFQSLPQFIGKPRASGGVPPS